MYYQSRTNYNMTWLVLVTCVSHVLCPIAAGVVASFTFPCCAFPCRRSSYRTLHSVVLYMSQVLLLRWQRHNPVGGRSRGSLVERRLNPMNTRHGADAAREHSRTHNRRNTGIDKGRKNNEPRGVHPFVISNVMRTAAHPRAALPSHNVQSSPTESHDLGKIRNSFTT